MNSFLTVLTVVYVLVGIAVYILTTEKVTAVEHTVESHVPINPVGYKSAIFLAIMFGWPIWILAQGLIQERKGPFDVVGWRSRPTPAANRAMPY